MTDPSHAVIEEKRQGQAARDQHAREGIMIGKED